MKAVKLHSIVLRVPHKLQINTQICQFTFHNISLSIIDLMTSLS